MAGREDSCEDTTWWFVLEMLFCSHNSITQKAVFGDVRYVRQKYVVGKTSLPEIK